MVVCSDRTAGGRGEREDIGLSELVCRVTTDPAAIAALLNEDNAGTRAVFCTYQSLPQVMAAQSEHGAPPFDLTIADEAHRTTGVDRAASGLEGKGAFQAVHSEEGLASRKRLYMTATPRIYSAASRASLRSKGIETVDMGDFDVYGPELHRLPFARAVNAGMLSDYRVIVLGVHEGAVSPGLRNRLVELGEEQEEGRRPLVVRSSDITRVLGASLAVNGAMEGREEDKPGRLFKTLAFANSIPRSKFFSNAMKHPQVLRATTRRLRATDDEGERAMRVESQHLDASSSALERNLALRELDRAKSDGALRLLCNVRLFSEGVDVPSLDAVAFMEPRDSQVDVVQAVGRVMRRSEGKRFGYIVVPVPVEPRDDVASALAEGSEGYRTLGRVLRALQAHDERLAEDPLRFVTVHETPPPNGGGGNGGDEDLQEVLDLRDVSAGLYAQVVAASGLGRPGLMVSQDIEYAVKAAARRFEEAELEGPLAGALGLVVEMDGGAKGVCTIAALLLANACLLHRRLGGLPDMPDLPPLNGVGGEADPAGALHAAWHAILERDYAPVFEPALAVLDALPERRAVGHAVRMVAECANRVADSLSELGYDHAGPLYHRILGSAKSDGAFYTNNVSALMLARLALSEDFADWSDPEAVARLRIMDPACGTGTLLMAAMQTIKARMGGASAAGDPAALHRRLVEDVLCGLDINRHAIQLAACNLTLGAPTVDYRRMNLFTLRHGPQADGSVKAGSLEILGAAGGPASLDSLAAPLRTLGELEAAQVDSAPEAAFPLENIDLVIMNPPFTDNVKRGRKYGAAAVKVMQQHEIGIRNRLEQRDTVAGGAINSNSVRTFFTPLADKLLEQEVGAVAMVAPVTACTSASSVGERRFLAERFHIERIVTTHDPRRVNFSENTSIHECLMVLRRRSDGTRRPTEFVSLRQMPAAASEAIVAADAIAAASASEWGQVCSWPTDRIAAGDWSPAQWFDGTLADTIRILEDSPMLENIGPRYEVRPDGRAIRGVFRDSEANLIGAIRIFWSVGSELRRTMRGEPEAWRRPRLGKEAQARRYWEQRSHFLVAQRFRTTNGLLTGLWSPEASIGSGWVPVAVESTGVAQALAAWWNSTPARLMLLNRRSKTLDYPAWSLEQLREIRIPKPDNPAWGALKDAFDATCADELLPMKQAEECTVRAVIDEAAALALGLSPDVLADWRRRLAAEPTVSNRPAPGPEAD